MLRDGIGRPKGTVDTKQNGDQELRDPVGRLLARYDASANKTLEATSSRVIGTGNQLATKLPR